MSGAKDEEDPYNIETELQESNSVKEEKRDPKYSAAAPERKASPKVFNSEAGARRLGETDKKSSESIQTDQDKEKSEDKDYSNSQAQLPWTIDEYFQEYKRDWKQITDARDNFIMEDTDDGTVDFTKETDKPGIKRIIILGSTNADKRDFSKKIEQEYGVIHFSEETLARVAEQIDTKNFDPVSDYLVKWKATIQGLIIENEDCKKKGFILDDFPPIVLEDKQLCKDLALTHVINLKDKAAKIKDPELTHHCFEKTVLLNFDATTNEREKIWKKMKKGLGLPSVNLWNKLDLIMKLWNKLKQNKDCGSIVRIAECNLVLEEVGVEGDEFIHTLQSFYDKNNNIADHPTKYGTFDGYLKFFGFLLEHKPPDILMDFNNADDIYGWAYSNTKNPKLTSWASFLCCAIQMSSYYLLQQLTMGEAFPRDLSNSVSIAKVSALFCLIAFLIQDFWGSNLILAHSFYSMYRDRMLNIRIVFPLLQYGTVCLGFIAGLGGISRADNIWDVFDNVVAVAFLGEIDEWIVRQIIDDVKGPPLNPPITEMWWHYQRDFSINSESCVSFCKMIWPWGIIFFVNILGAVAMVIYGILSPVFSDIWKVPAESEKDAAFWVYIVLVFFLLPILLMFLIDIIESCCKKSKDGEIFIEDKTRINEEKLKAQHFRELKKGLDEIEATAKKNKHLIEESREKLKKNLQNIQKNKKVFDLYVDTNNVTTEILNQKIQDNDSQMITMHEEVEKQSTLLLTTNQMTKELSSNMEGIKSDIDQREKALKSDIDCDMKGIKSDIDQCEKNLKSKIKSASDGLEATLSSRVDTLLPKADYDEREKALEAKIADASTEMEAKMQKMTEEMQSIEAKVGALSLPPQFGEGTRPTDSNNNWNDALEDRLKKAEEKLFGGDRNASYDPENLTYEQRLEHIEKYMRDQQQTKESISTGIQPPVIARQSTAPGTLPHHFSFDAQKKVNEMKKQKNQL